MDEIKNLPPSFNQLMRWFLQACPNGEMNEIDGELVWHTGYVQCASDDDAPLGEL